jgi:hypothetical protein
MGAFMGAVAVPAPVVVLAATAVALATKTAIEFPIDAVVIVAALEALWSSLALLAWRRSRGFGLSRREQVAWVVFVGLFGFLGYVGFRLGRRWPVRVPCPHCGGPAARNRDECAACGTPFPAPALKGTEIFA